MNDFQYGKRRKVLMTRKCSEVLDKLIDLLNILKPLLMGNYYRLRKYRLQQEFFDQIQTVPNQIEKSSDL
jgi:hypothetical protein